MKKKAVVITHIPAPYQVAFAKALRKHLDVEFWFMMSIPESNRPAYWEMDLPEYCKILPTYLKKGQFFYCPDMKKRIEEYAPDYLVLHGRWNNLAWYPAYKWARKNQKKIVMGPFERPVGQNFAKEMIRKTLYQHVDAILCSGYKTVDYYTNKSKHVYLFGYAADIDRELSHPTRHVGDTITFLHSGSINQRFRVQDIVEAIERLAPKYPSIRLAISGNGPDRKQVENYIHNSSALSSKVSWIEVSSWTEVQDIYKQADVLISYPSYAGWGLTIPEGMASGMGIISGLYVTSARELLIPDYNGFLVDSKQELEQAIEAYASNPSLVETHGKLNKQIAKREGADEKAKRLVGILESL